MKRLLLLLCLAISFTLPAQENALTGIIRNLADSAGDWARQPERYDIQVIYTQIDRDEQNRPHFTSHPFRLEADNYFYPASTVKMPAAFLALEKLNGLNIRGLDKWTPMRTGAATPPQAPVMTDPTAGNLLPSLAHYIKKIFLVSDNDAFNRLYEFLGQAYFNEALWAKGYDHLRILHRLAAPQFDAHANRFTNPVTFYRFDTVFYHQGEVLSQVEPSFSLKNEQRGKGYLDNRDQLVRETFDFRQRNFISLQDLHDMLQAVVFPGAVPAGRRFRLTEDDYRFLYQVMSELPRESRFPDYQGKPDNYVKFWIYGDRDSTVVIPEHIRIFNKVGWAYGFLSDVAYIVDLEQGLEFILAGVIHVNDNQVYNDGIYEYETTGLPFFGELGRAVYQYERARPRPRKPDLSRFRVGYD